ncbi:Grainyhead-like protein 2, variant 2 [Homalodisca vitripennis]|nr:Grainyhead-like protein 2, variant 2 [Homalodisca vitripennis]
MRQSRCCRLGRHRPAIRHNHGTLQPQPITRALTARQAGIPSCLTRNGQRAERKTRDEERRAAKRKMTATGRIMEGAERKTRDEERRAAKRKMTATGRKKMDELYHPACDRSEFYHMQDLAKPPVLFSPAEDIDKLTSMELQGFYGHETDTSSLSNGEAGSLKHTSPFLLHSGGKGPSTPTLKFHNHFPPDTLSDKKDLDGALTTDGTVFSSPPLKRPKMVPPLNERVMLYVRQDAEDVYTPLHVAPPTTTGLLNADYSQN